MSWLKSIKRCHHCQKLAANAKKRGSYLSFTPEEKAKVAEYASVNGVRAALRHFGEKGKQLKENTVRDWVKAYRQQIQIQRATQWKSGVS